MGATIYLDESGCLGWKLEAPYQRGGSSRFFTLAAAIIPDGAEPSLERVVRGVYKHRGRSARNELKSVHLSAGERIGFAGELAKLRDKRPTSGSLQSRCARTTSTPRFAARRTACITT